MSGEGPDLPALIPELVVTDIGRSLAFWCDLIGFAVLYERADEHFAMVVLGDAAVMLEQWQPGAGQWIAGDLAPPFGRGLNLQIEVAATQPILDRLQAAAWPLFMVPEEKWYRAANIELGQRQFVVQDPDGYMLRPYQSLGTRAAG